MTFNLYKNTSNNQYFIAHQSIPYANFPKHFTLEDQSTHSNALQALQHYSSYNIYLFLIS